MPSNAAHSFHPPRRTLMGPGPSDVSARVLGALSRPTIGHLDPAFIELMDEVKALLQFAFQTRNELTLPVSRARLRRHGDLLRQPHRARRQSDRLPERRLRRTHEGERRPHRRNAGDGRRRMGRAGRSGESEARHRRHIPTPSPSPSCTPRHRPASKATPRRSARLRTTRACCRIVDTVTSLGGIEVAVDAWGADAVYSGTQKCLSCVPGLSPITFSERAADRIRKRKTPVQSWFLDLNLVMGYWGGARAGPIITPLRSTPSTPSTKLFSR